MVCRKWFCQNDFGFFLAKKTQNLIQWGTRILTTFCAHLALEKGWYRVYLLYFVWSNVSNRISLCIQSQRRRFLRSINPNYWSNTPLSEVGTCILAANGYQHLKACSWFCTARACRYGTLFATYACGQPAPFLDLPPPGLVKYWHKKVIHWVPSISRPMTRGTRGGDPGYVGWSIVFF